jgi:hypothetical protein
LRFARSQSVISQKATLQVAFSASDTVDDHNRSLAIHAIGDERGVAADRIFDQMLSAILKAMSE